MIEFKLKYTILLQSIAANLLEISRKLIYYAALFFVLYLMQRYKQYCGDKQTYVLHTFRK